MSYSTGKGKNFWTHLVKLLAQRLYFQARTDAQEEILNSLEDKL